ncbi:MULTISPECIES: hypothetical protein [Pseudomonas]|uniref:hypothetical protein n=1 Tax=Pseudomonas TaxID=286 RepID=UPI000CD0B348|nr:MULTISPECIES: hypothetical protein [unclassified Pseudomonas]POA31881.1 hypothetical protein C1887_12085 [Pseudomonas sp. GW456-R21]POA68612.1 hypothetical protein C1884_09730 [Pseudomonas sp. GW460-R15]
MHPVAKKYSELNPEKQKKVQIDLCKKAYKLWLNYTSNNGITEYRETIAGTVQKIDFSLPYDAIEAVIHGKDELNINERYLEPAAALQDEDLKFSADMEMAYYSIYNLYQYHITGKLGDSWVIVNQALSALGEYDTIKHLEAAINSAA